MRSWSTALTALAALSLSLPCAATDTPFKLGTFERNGRAFAGLVVDDRWVVDIAAANARLQKEHPNWKPLVMPAGMKELIEGYDGERQERLHAIANEAPTAAPRVDVYEVKALHVRPPVPDPETMVNAAVNYAEHGAEVERGRPAPSPPAAPAPSVPGLWEPRNDDARWTPYLFLKARSALIADGEAIRIPPGRDKIDWECELAVIVGRRASRVPIDRARDHIFGYTMENDVSDRGGRGDARHGSDWLVGKGHDTFAPVGPFIVPKEFIPDPQALRIRFALSGTLMQDSTTAHDTHGRRDAAVRVEHPDLAAGRRHLHGEPRRCGLHPEPADLHEARRRRGVHDRGDRNAHEPGGRRREVTTYLSHLASHSRTSR